MEVSSHLFSHREGVLIYPRGFGGRCLFFPPLPGQPATPFPLHQARASREALLGLPSQSPKGEELPVASKPQFRQATLHSSQASFSF